MKCFDWLGCAMFRKVKNPFFFRTCSFQLLNIFIFHDTLCYNSVAKRMLCALLLYHKDEDRAHWQQLRSYEKFRILDLLHCPFSPIKTLCSPVLSKSAASIVVMLSLIIVAWPLSIPSAKVLWHFRRRVNVAGRLHRNWRLQGCFWGFSGLSIFERELEKRNYKRKTSSPDFALGFFFTE